MDCDQDSQARTSFTDGPSLERTAAANLPKAILQVVRKVLLGEVGSPRSGKSAGSDMPESAGLISWMSSTKPNTDNIQVKLIIIVPQGDTSG